MTDLPGVGRNLIDHVHVPVIAIPTPGVPHDPLVMNPIGIRYTASGSAEFNDMHMYFFNFYNKDLWQGPGLDVPWPSIAVIPGLQRPRARGRVSLRSLDPDVPVNTDLNYLDAEDVRRMVEGVRIAWRLMNSAPFAPYIKEFFNITKTIVDSNSATADFVRNNCGTIYHPTTTAKMGPKSDPEAVVDQYFRVHGVEGCAWPTPR